MTCAAMARTLSRGLSIHGLAWLVAACLAVACQCSIAAQGAPPQLTRAQLVEQVCRAPELVGGTAVDTIRRIEQRFGPTVNQAKGHRILVAVVDSDVINAWNQNSTDMSQSLICVPSAMVNFMGSEGELAFIFAHETGHALDDPCKTADGRARLVTPNARPWATVLGALLDQSGPVTEQQACETRADEIGFNILTRSGYNPFDAAGAFGRLEMYAGDTGTGLLARFAALSSDHPMTSDRIRHMRALLVRAPAGANR